MRNLIGSLRRLSSSLVRRRIASDACASHAAAFLLSLLLFLSSFLLLMGDFEVRVELEHILLLALIMDEANVPGPAIHIPKLLRAWFAYPKLPC